MEKLIIRFYFMQEQNARKHFWEKPKIGKKTGEWKRIPVWIFQVPEYDRKGKAWDCKELDRLLFQELCACADADTYYLPYSLFEKRLGHQLKSVPTVTSTPDFIWQPIANRYQNYWGIIILEGEGLYYHDWIWQRAKTLKYLGIVPASYGSQAEELAEEISEEYGLNVTLADSFAQLTFPGHYPLLVLDASEELKLDLRKMQEGSVWMDLCSDTSKRRRLEGRYKKIVYFSLKKELEALQYLDTGQVKQV